MTAGERASDEGATASPRGRLLRKYAVILAALVAGALVVAGAGGGRPADPPRRAGRAGG